MSNFRYDGSVESAYLPISYGHRNFAIYKTQVLKVYYIDDPQNISYKSQSPYLTYDVVVIGGINDGRILSQARNGVQMAGNGFNFSEVCLQSVQSPVSFNDPAYVPSNQQIGDMAYVTFIDGNVLFPIIIGFAANGQSTYGTSSAEAPRKQEQYNGVYTLIDNKGNYTLTAKGGALDSSSKVFTPNTSGNNAEIQLEGQNLNLSVNSGQINIEISAQNDSVNITTKGGALIQISGQNNDILLKDGKGGELNISNGKIALGSSAAELLSLFNQTLTAIEALTVICGAPGAPSSPPVNSAQFSSIQSSLNSIKGSL